MATQIKESRATLACLYRTSGRVYMLQFISVDSILFTQQARLTKDMGLL